LIGDGLVDGTKISAFPKIIINADDFGRTESINKGIVLSFMNKLITSTTIMTNMPYFKQACDLAKINGFHNRIGIHLNLSEGVPITDSIKKCRKFCNEDGSFKNRQTVLRLTKSQSSAVKEELQAQINTCLDQAITPTHLDSHHHVHKEWAFGKIVIDLAQKYRIAAVRLTRNCGVGISLLKKIYKFAYNKRLAYYGLAKSRHFCNVEDVKSLPMVIRLSEVVEVAVHPTIDDDGRIIDYMYGVELQSLINNLGPRTSVDYEQLINSYGSYSFREKLFSINL
jgi:predicted glycoside hydrolase/deacetylase ChbG (UPF0249 family)